MKFDIELHAFLEAAKRLNDKRLLETLQTKQLEQLGYEIAEDPEIVEEVKKLLK